MKAALAVVALLVIAGGVLGALYFMGMPPFARAAPKARTRTAAPPRAGTRTGTRPSSGAERRGDAPARPRKSAALAADEREKVARLAAIYEQMPVEDAARILAKVADPLVEGILRRMDERQVSKLLAALPPDRAARLTRALAR